MTREGDRLRRRVGACARDDRHTAGGRLDAQLDDAHVLLMAGRGLAGRPDRHQPVGSLPDLPIDEGLEGFLVDFPVLERRQERDDGPRKHTDLRTGTRNKAGTLAAADWYGKCARPAHAMVIALVLALSVAAGA